MLHAACFTLAAAALAHALTGQVPLVSSQRREWNLNNLPNPNATDHLVFETVSSLLQIWPNTRMRNGHSIVPGIIPKGTLLYHGRSNEELPSGPEWTATDPEHSYLFCRDIFHRSTKADCWHLTLMATRPLKVIYLDGNSAAKLPYGSMDTQDLILWGKIGELYGDEMKRIQDFCKWGKNFGVDAIVRMQMDFEIMLCDFTSGTSVVSFANLASGWTNQSVTLQFHAFGVITSGSWHHRSPGETRIQLDLPGLVSFYDTQLAPSLVPIRIGQERWGHRVLNISSEDLSAVKSRLEANLIRPDDESSGVDWKTLIQVIVDRYAQRFELTHYLLNSSATDPHDILDLAKKAQTQLRIMLTPYLLFSATPTDQSLSKGELDWTIPIYKLCATTHTDSMETRFESMTDSEKLLLQAVRGTSREICRVVTKMWAAGVYAGIDPTLNTKPSPNISKVMQLRDTWMEDLDRLMTWLDWNVWVKCNPGCSPEEMCYLPTWPIGFPWFAPFPNPSPFPFDHNDDLLHSEQQTAGFNLRTMVMRNLANEARNSTKLELDEWIRPQPKCVRQIEPYAF